MSERTAIEWCDATFNPWWGCVKVSPACDHCYAERDAKRFAPGRALWGVGAERRTFGDKHWGEPEKWAKRLPAKLGRRPRVFCASMGDWLDLDAPITDFVRLLNTIRLTPELDWLLLSKRIGNWRKRLEEASRKATGWLRDWILEWLGGRPPGNVWLGATVVNQPEADRDVSKLLAVPAAVRFLSIEPMLGPVDLTDIKVERKVGTDHFDALHYDGSPDDDVDGGTATLDWVICGGESGPKARPMHPQWAADLRDQCAAAGTAFLFKQWGEWTEFNDCGLPGTRVVRPGDPEHDEMAARCDAFMAPDGELITTADLARDDVPYRGMVRPGKKAAGRLLDGIEHNGFPSCAR